MSEVAQRKFVQIGPKNFCVIFDYKKIAIKIIPKQRKGRDEKTLS